MIPVILSGGSGTRLWPASRLKLPKQFCSIFEKTLHASTLQRLAPLGEPWIITSQQLRDLTLRDMKEFKIPSQNLVLEPFGKNTAPAIALICHLLSQKKLKNEIVGIFPADHLIEDEEAFSKAIQTAVSSAEQNRVVTLGILPHSPAIGYGYIQLQTSGQSSRPNESVFPVLRFHEKPNLPTAEKFLKSGEYFWNAGIFIFKVETMVQAFETHMPDLWRKIIEVKADLTNLREIYQAVDGQSIDYGIMEKLSPEQLSCVPSQFGWSDVGSWDAVADLLGPSSEQMAEVQANRNFVSSKSNKKYIFSNIDDVILVDSDDACLITTRGHSQSVKEAQALVQSKWPKLASEHQFETRPWGEFQVLRDDKNFKSKVLLINPGQQISYQSHKHREEHWLIVEGSRIVILNDKDNPVQSGSYIKIPLGAKHRIRNTGSTPLRFVEVQLGTYFGEDDITRYQDDYQRS